MKNETKEPVYPEANPSFNERRLTDPPSPYDVEDFESGHSMQRVNQNGFAMDYPFDYAPTDRIPGEKPALTKTQQ